MTLQFSTVLGGSMGIVMHYGGDLAFESMTRTVVSADGNFLTLSQYRLLTLQFQVLSGSSSPIDDQVPSGWPISIAFARSWESLSDNRLDTQTDESPALASDHLESRTSRWRRKTAYTHCRRQTLQRACKLARRHPDLQTSP